MKALKTAKAILHAGKWPINVPHYTDELVIGLFIGKTSWHDRYVNVFSSIETNYPEMVNWLNMKQSTKDEDLDAWGSIRSKYTLDDLKEYISNNGTLKDPEDDVERKAREEQGQRKKEQKEQAEKEQRERLQREERERQEHEKSTASKKKKKNTR